MQNQKYNSSTISSQGIKKEEIPIENQFHLFQPWKVFIFEASLFCLTLVLGIATAIKLNNFLKIQEISLPSFSFLQFIFYFLLTTLFILFFSFFGKKFKKGRKTIFKAIFIFAVMWGGLISLSLWIGDIFALLFIIILIFGWLKKPSILLHDLAIILGLAGIGSSLGLRISPQLVVLLLIFFSIYDFIAVYKTKHMIKMAKEMIETGAILALIVPQKTSDFLADLKEVRLGGRFLILGGGDIAFPLLFCASLVPQGVSDSLIVGIFSLFGLFAGYLFFISQKTRQPIPALPPIAIFSIIGFLITKLI
ncbi:presenilin family intramembrane aspartyl protease [Patescibacteria group bacterium]